MADTDDDKKSAGKKDVAAKTLELAHSRFKLAVDAEAKIRTEALDDLKFRAGDQWPEAARREREQDGRPCLTINRLPQFVRQVTNDQRQNRPSIQVNPVDSKATVETAKVFQGMIRHIEANSNADVAYDTAFEAAVSKGIGYFRIVTGYADAMSFNQEITIKRILNSFSVYMDPHYTQPDGSDANWAFVFETMSKDDYLAKFPDSELCGMDDWTSIGDRAADWATKDTCRIAEYFYKTFEETSIVQMSDGSVVKESDLPKPPAQLPNGLTVSGKRKTMLPAIKWAKINAVEVLEETDWLGSWIPVIPVIGDWLDVDGEKKLEGIIRHAKDSQRQYNYWSTSETETIALAPRAPFIGVAGQFTGFEEKWQTANSKNHAYLEYNDKGINGEAIGPPARNTFEPPVQAITAAKLQSSDDLKATTGIYDASLGNRSNENSGVAIQRRNQQSQMSNFHFIDNLSRALRHAGRIMVELIPYIYDTAQTVRILHEDDKAEMVQINQIFQEGGQYKSHILSAGKYDVSVATGPSYATKRQEAVASMLDFIKVYPSAAPIIGDLVARSMDWAGSAEIADRLKKTLPPNIADNDDKNQAPIPPQVQAQIQQQGQMIEQLTAHLKQKTELVNQKTLELESRERIEALKVQAELEIALAQLGSKEALQLLSHQVSEIETRIGASMRQPMQSQIQDQAAAGLQSAVRPTQQQPPTGGIQTPG